MIAFGGRRAGKQAFIDAMKAACAAAFDVPLAEQEAVFLRVAGEQLGAAMDPALTAAVFRDVYEPWLRDRWAQMQADEKILDQAALLRRTFSGEPGTVISYRPPATLAGEQAYTRCAYCRSKWRLARTADGSPRQVEVKCLNCGAPL